MKNKKTIVAIIAVLLVVVVGATFAYYTSNTAFENVFNAGKYKVTLTEVFESPDNWVPGETVPKTVTAKNEGTVPATVRISYTEQWLKEIDGVETDITSQVSPNPANINFDNQDDWTSSNGYYYYKYILEPTNETSSFISGVTLDPNLNSVTCTGEGNTKTCEAQNKASGAKYKLTFTIQTIQYDVYKSEWNTEVEIKENSAITYLSRQVEGQITPGDVIGIGETEDFYVVSSTPEKTVLLAKYNLLVGNTNNADTGWNVAYLTPANAGYGLQNEDAIGYNQGGSYIGVVAFSSTNYWSDDSSQIASPYNVDDYVYDPTYNSEPEFTTECDDDTCWYAENYSIAYYVEEYVERLKSMGAPSTITGRLLSYEEADSVKEVGRVDVNIGELEYNSIIFNNQDYWLGTASNYYSVTTVSDDASYFNSSYYYDNYYMCSSTTYPGVRPVIEIPTSDLQ